MHVRVSKQAEPQRKMPHTISKGVVRLTDRMKRAPVKD